MEITPELLVGFAGILLSLLFSYIPGLRVWYGGLIAEKKQLIMLSLLILVTGGIFALGCFDILQISLACDKQGVISLAKMLVAGLVANQSTFLLTPQTNDVVVAKQLRDDKFAAPDSEPE